MEAHTCCACSAMLRYGRFSKVVISKTMIPTHERVTFCCCKRASVSRTSLSTLVLIGRQCLRLQGPLIPPCPSLTAATPSRARTAGSATASYAASYQGMSALGNPQQKYQQRSPKMAKIDVITTLRVKRLSENAVVPSRGSCKAAGYDLSRLAAAVYAWSKLVLCPGSLLTHYCACSAYEYTVPAQGKEVVKTDLAIAIPSGTYARVAPRSGLAVKSFIDTGAGVIDEDYRGNVGVVLFNHGQTDFKGDF